MISKSQRIHFMAQLWPDACAAQKWQRGDDEKRYALFAQVLGHKPRHARKLARGQHISLNDFDNADFDQVKAHLKMLADNLAGAIEVNNPEIGLRRRLEYKIKSVISALDSALQVGTDRWAVPSEPDRWAVPSEPDRRAVPSDSAVRYAQQIMRDRFGASDLSALDEPQLRQLLITLTARLSSKRREGAVPPAPQPDPDLCPF